MRIASAGHAIFSASMIALGILGVIKDDFTAVWLPVFAHVPASDVLAYLCAFVSLASGVGMFWQRTQTVAASVLFGYLLLWLLLFKAPIIFTAPTSEGSYQYCGEFAVIVAGAWVLYAWFANDWQRRRLGFAVGDNGVRAARVLYALALITFGLSHFVYVDITSPLVPAWLPAHVFWAYFTGCTYLTAGAAMLVNVYARLAAALSVFQMGVFLLLVWIPILVAGNMSTFQWGEMYVTCVLIAGAWVIADSYRGNSMFSVSNH